MPKSILIVAAERGLGLGLAGQFFHRGWRVTGTARIGADTTDLEAVGAGAPSRLSIARIDVTDAGQIEPLLVQLGERRFDVIYFNAGIYGPLHQSVVEASNAEFAEIMLTNTFGPIRLAHRLLGQLAPLGPTVLCPRTAVAPRPILRAAWSYTEPAKPPSTCSRADFGRPTMSGTSRCCLSTRAG